MDFFYAAIGLLLLVLIVAFVALVVVLAYRGHAERSRTHRPIDFEVFAKELGFQYVLDVRDLPGFQPRIHKGLFYRDRLWRRAIDDFLGPYEGLYPFTNERRRVVQNVVSGKSDGIEWTVFEFRCIQGDEESGFLVCSARLPVEIPAVTLEPRKPPQHANDRFQNWYVGENPATFEEMYSLTKTDRITAKELLDPQLQVLLHQELLDYRLQFFLRHSPPYIWHTRGSLVLMIRPVVTSAADREAFEALREFVRLIPARYYEQAPLP